ncbi:MAG TPA: pyridoxamine 5'-phosphate oxidase family protein [Chloroflexota bacterium]|nr:pyridoxamine 5'-phosphate oxidase family protein [Chloroflexota bacterium]
MPASYGIDRRATAGLLPWSAVVDQLVHARNYWVGTVHPAGRPHARPVWGLWLDNAFYFSTDPASRTGRNLAAHPALVVHLESGDDVVILEGTAEAVTDTALLTRVADAYEAEYAFRPDLTTPRYGVYRLRPRGVFAWREAAFSSTATRWVYGARWAIAE